MKLQLNLPNHLQLEISVNKDSYFPDSKTNVENSVSKFKKRIIKLYPQHWYDGVWENLDYKM